MLKIEFPPYQPKIKRVNDKDFIFDEVRKRWVLLTPEEWVRQNFLQYLIFVKKYPASLIAVEKQIRLNDLKKRFDIVVFDQNSQPWMIVECKAMDVPLDKTVLDQVLRYNASLRVQFLVITNGSYCKAFMATDSSFKEMDEFPA